MDQRNTYVFEVNSRAVVESAGKSLPYWSTANGDDTMVTLWNPADEAQDYIFKLFFSGGHYGFPVHLEPKATQTFNISEIIATQVPDAEGNIIPASVQDGSMKVVGNQADNQAILVAMDSAVYNVDKATCGPPQICWTCDGYTQSSVAADPFGVAVSNTNQLAWTLTWDTGQQYDYTSMSGTGWSSSATNVATVQTGLVRGVSAGSTNVTAYYGNFVPAYAQIPCGGPDPCPVGGGASGSSPGTVTPTISQSQNLWYFGNGISPPQGFSLGGTTATLTASGGGSGTYAWSITAGSSKASLQGTTSGNNVTSVQIASQSYSTQANDVTVQLQFTPSGGSMVAATHTLSVDSPYKLIPGGLTHKGVNSCSDTTGGGIYGYKTQVLYTAQSFFGVTLGNIAVNENFASFADDYIGNNWPLPTAGGLTLPSSGAFADTLCVVDPGLTLTPRVLTPQSPLQNEAIDHDSQSWFIGSTSPATGVEVQSDTQQYYQDHGAHLNVVSPVR